MKTITIIIRNSKSCLYLSSLLAAALVSGQLAAATLVLDGCTIPIQSTATLDLATGDIIAFTDGPNECVEGTESSGSAPSVSFTVNGSTSTTVTIGTDVNAAWSSSGADSCAASGGWSGSGWNSTGKSLSGTQSLPTGSATPNTYSLSLACTNSSGTTTRSRSVSIVEESTGSCTGSAAPPSGMTRETNMDWDNTSKTTESWFDLWGTTFPNGSNTKKVRVRPNRYGALAFNSGTSASGKIDFSPPSGTFQSSVGTGNAVITFSACPGDFGPQEDVRCRKNVSGSSRFDWSKTTSSFKCTIENNQAMYFNITYASEVSDTGLIGPWNCDGSTTQTCGHLITAQGE